MNYFTTWGLCFPDEALAENLPVSITLILVCTLSHMLTTWVAHRFCFKPRPAKCTTQAEPSAWLEPQGASLGAVPVLGLFFFFPGEQDQRLSTAFKALLIFIVSNCQANNLFVSLSSRLINVAALLNLSKGEKWPLVLFNILWLYQPVLTQPSIFTWNNGMSFAKFFPPFFIVSDCLAKFISSPVWAPLWNILSHLLKANSTVLCFSSTLSEEGACRGCLD